MGWSGENTQRQPVEWPQHTLCALYPVLWTSQHFNLVRSMADYMLSHSLWDKKSLSQASCCNYTKPKSCKRKTERNNPSA